MLPPQVAAIRSAGTRVAIDLCPTATLLTASRLSVTLQTETLQTVSQLAATLSTWLQMAATLTMTLLTVTWLAEMRCRPPVAAAVTAWLHAVGLPQGMRQRAAAAASHARPLAGTAASPPGAAKPRRNTR